MRERWSPRLRWGSAARRRGRPWARGTWTRRRCSTCDPHSLTASTPRRSPHHWKMQPMNQKETVKNVSQKNWLHYYIQLKLIALSLQKVLLTRNGKLDKKTRIKKLRNYICEIDIPRCSGFPIFCIGISKYYSTIRKIWLLN